MVDGDDVWMISDLEQDVLFPPDVLFFTILVDPISTNLLERHNPAVVMKTLGHINGSIGTLRDIGSNDFVVAQSRHVFLFRLDACGFFATVRTVLSILAHGLLT